MTKKKTTPKRGKKRKKNKGIVLIKKSNNLIESRYKFDIWETRVFLSVLSQIKRSDDEFEVYRIWYKDIIRAFGLKSGDSYSLLRNAAKSLMSKSFYVSYEDKGAMREKQYHILREIDYLKAGQEGRVGDNHEYIDVTVETKMKPLLLQLQRNFTAYDLQNVVHLGVYPVRVYELLKQYESIGYRVLRVEEMKRMFEVTDQYALFGDFNRWIIKPAIKEINEHTDIFVSDIERIKEGRKIVALRFIFHTNKREVVEATPPEVIQPSLPFPMDEPQPSAGGQAVSTDELSLADQLFEEFHPVVVKKYGVTPSVFLKLAKKYNKTEIEQAIRVTQRAKVNNQIHSSVSGFFIKALEEGFTDAKEEAKKRKAENDAKKTILDQLESLKSEQAAEVNDVIRKLTGENPKLTQRAISLLKKSSIMRVIIEEREKSLKRGLELEDYRQDRVLREMVKGKIVEMEAPSFKAILDSFGPKIQALEQKVESLG